jgi:hypothetical protein
MLPLNRHHAKFPASFPVGGGLYYFLSFLFLRQFKGYPGRKETRKDLRGWQWKKEGEGAPLFSTDRTPRIFIRSLFGSGIVKFGIAGKTGVLWTDSG